MVREGKIKAEHPIAHKVKPEQAPEIYQMLKGGGKECLGILFDWS
tara:strand:- start:756 stop:890 length:135 start_codon:yes stop_codon:yes gene_type:complete